MKRLILVRHAKSSWADPGMADIDRPLNERGKRDAPEMGRRLLDRGLKPDLVVSSAARRARATARRLAEALGIERQEILIVERLYEASVATWLEVIAGLPAAPATVMLVGHNPGLTDLVNRLLVDARIDNVPTCGVLCAEYPVRSWSAVPASRPTAWSFDYPKNPAP